jgi:hypothetical protein
MSFQKYTPGGADVSEDGDWLFAEVPPGANIICGYAGELDGATITLGRVSRGGQFRAYRKPDDSTQELVLDELVDEVNVTAGITGMVCARVTGAGNDTSLRFFWVRHVPNFYR